MRPSLRRRLLATLLAPMIGLAALLGLVGWLLIHLFVQHERDRLLTGSALAIAERLTVEDGAVAVDLPAVALGMLDNQAHDSVYYSVTHNGRLITGYADLPRPTPPPAPGQVAHRDGLRLDQPVRIAALAQRLYGRDEPVLVQVAETLQGRRALESDLLLGMLILETLLVLAAAAFTFRAVGWGMAPLERLSRVVAARATPGAVILAPLPRDEAPLETLPLIDGFNALLRRLDQTLEGMRRFTADASHQLRTPIAVLRTHLALLRRLTATDDPAVLAAVNDVDGAVLRLDRLIAQLIALARADAQGVAPALEPVDLVGLAAEIAAEQAPRALAAGVEIVFDAPEDGADGTTARGAPLLISEILSNLLDNALHHSPAGGVIWVRVAAGPEGPRVEIQDQGPGVPGALRARVFERFYRIPGVGSEGSGLGLAIVRALADRIGARVELRDPPQGRGALAVAVFPPAPRQTGSE